MEHVDPEVLALVALGEPVAAADRAHLEACGTCADEVASLAAVVALGRSAPDSAGLVAPPARVWDRISAELALAEPATVTDLAGRRRRGPVIAAVAAATGLIVGGLGGAWWVSDLRGRPVQDVVVARAVLDPLPGWAATGAARVERTPDGRRVLVVSLAGDGKNGDFLQVWLIDRAVQRLVSVGVLTGTQGRFALPAGLDLTDFPVVDVSEEPFDGNPAHSGDSVVRGVLGA